MSLYEVLFHLFRNVQCLISSRICSLLIVPDVNFVDVLRLLVIVFLYFVCLLS